MTPQDVLARKQRGLTDGEIAAEFGLSTDAVRKFRKDNGIKNDPAAQRARWREQNPVIADGEPKPSRKCWRGWKLTAGEVAELYAERRYTNSPRAMGDDRLLLNLPDPRRGHHLVTLGGVSSYG